MEKEIRDKILNIMETNQISYGELSKRTNLSKSTLQRYMTKEDSKVSVERLMIIAKGLNTTPAYLMGWDADEAMYSKASISFIKVPLYGEISCGNGAFVDDNVIDYIAVPDDNLNSNSEYFAQIAKGDSMINSGINDGDIIVFEKVSAIDDNKIGCFCIDDNIATCKRFKKGKSFIQLIPSNQNYDPIVVDLENSNFRILGKLRKVIKEFD